MDTSKEYIEMCSKATEIQKNHKWTVGDYKVGPKTIALVIDSDEEVTVSEGLALHWLQGIMESLWLPRQDQLQEMCIDPVAFHLYSVYYDLLNTFCIWVDNLNISKKKYNSLEQLWLAFVMKEKYNKVWNNGEWK